MKPLQSESDRIATLERVLARDAERRFVVRSKQYLSGQPERVLHLNDTGKLHRELGFPHGHKVVRFLQQYPLFFQTSTAISGATVLLGLSGEPRKTRPKPPWPRRREGENESVAQRRAEYRLQWGRRRSRQNTLLSCSMFGIE